LQDAKRISKGRQPETASAKSTKGIRPIGGIPIALDSGNWNPGQIRNKFIRNSYNKGKNKEDAIMKEGMKVKVIKKNEIKPQVKPVVKSKRASAREVVANVTNWVTDLQTRKRDETKIAIEKFFGQNPQPSEL
jgi:hypothetical protein